MMSNNISDDIVGGPARHIPVMLQEVLSVFQPFPSSSNSYSIIDGTFGAGGYTRALLENGVNVMAIDRDPDAIERGQEIAKEFPQQLKLVAGQFSNLEELARENDFESVDGVVLDIGVSSMQLDEAERGFSFQNDGPLDMRMSQSGVSAADVVNMISQPDLTRLIGLLGEEKRASQVSRAIVNQRKKQEFTTTSQLANLIEKTLGRHAKDRIHPATRTFQALRIFVNQELEELGKALFAAEKVLKEGGRLVVVTFHSLEDRMVKIFFKNRAGEQQTSRHLPFINQSCAIFTKQGKGLLRAADDEIQLNPRARSAKLRWASRTSVKCGVADMSIFGLPTLASISSFQGESR